MAALAPLLLAGLAGVAGGAAAQPLIIEPEPSSAEEEKAQDAEEDARSGAGADGASAWRMRVDRAVLEGGALTESSPPVDWTGHAELVVNLSGRLGRHWEVNLGAFLEGELQREGPHAEVTDGAAELDENWLRVRAGNWRLTAGTQTLLWGRVDELPPTAGIGTRDLTRFALEPLAQRRRASPAVRLEVFPGDWKLDFVYLPVLREAELPDTDSIWHPVDRTDGRFFGRPSSPILASLIRAARFQEDSRDDGGGGIRISSRGERLDLGLTGQYVRRSEPYYRLDNTTRVALLSGQEPTEQPVLTAEHPRTWLAGADAAVAVGGWTWRLEAAWRSDVPVTRTDTLRMETVDGVDWALAAEGFPGGGDFRMSLQVSGDHLLDAGPVQEIENAYRLGGELETPFLDHRARARVRFFTGLERENVYANPELAWIGWEPHEFYLGFHVMEGDERTAGGFFEERDMIVLGWRGTF